MLTFLLLIILSLSGCSRESNLPKLFPVPSAMMSSHRGGLVNLDAHKGKVVIYDFIFTSCAGTCPVMTQKMKKLADRLPYPDVQFVSISVDPVKDTPEVLANYAKSFGVDERWTFYVASRETITDVSIKGFKLATGPGIPGSEPLLHSTKFVLVDRKGMIRGYYDSLSDAEMTKLAADARDLLREAP